MLELKNIEVTFNRGTKLATMVLKNLNLKILTGQFVTLIGGNGAGKSTLLNTCAGDITPDHGRILLDQQDVTNSSTEERAFNVSRVFQDPAIGTFPDLTIEENLSLAYHRGHKRNLRRSLGKNLRELFKTKLAPLHMNLEKRLDEKVSGLSGGQRQALSLVMATLQPSKLLLLDEHTAALDPKIARTLMEITDQIVRQEGRTTLMITHSMSQALAFGTRTLMESID